MRRSANDAWNRDWTHAIIQYFRKTNEERRAKTLAAVFFIPILRPATEGPIDVQGQW